MATVNLGRIKFVWQGAYSGATAYVADDVVSYNGSSYICILASTNNLPTNTTYWNQMSSAGTNGTNGTDINAIAGLQAGDILTYNGTSFVRLAKGTANQVLRVNSGATALEFGTAPSGKVLQVITATDSTQRNTSSTTFVTASNTMSVAITPASASNKIFLIVSSNLYNGAAQVYSISTIFRDATDLGAASNRGLTSMYTPIGSDASSSMCMTILDSPNTTSAITYQVYFRTSNVSGGAELNQNYIKGSITAFEIGA